eukprot:CAMPEP_0177602268 /NCGR_PEP_ID=MMETSP0419_2-20121207/14763_1 /TAXON_ID=582737 /ORGANISM="Tetraselmis sp., Strain GSL018" /LENGTH=452 /DNA_ID=CAMNT_0019095711 /DNA_START=443 /DNA_END=1801 /DNA_ORIENTATION=-
MVHAVNKQVSDGRSYIRLADLEFHRSQQASRKFRMMDGANSVVQVVIFEVKDRDLVGHRLDDGSRRICCSQKLAVELHCTPGRAIVQEVSTPDKNTPWVHDIYFEGNESVAHAAETAVLSIKQTGMYHMWFVTCDPELADATVHGMTTWKNPHGFLPGMMAANLHFFGAMSLASLFLGFAWLILYVRHWQSVIPLQHCITALISLTMMEFSTWYFDFVNFNSSGFRPHMTTIWAVLLGSLRKALSRMLVLVVSMGYGVVRPTLGGLSKTVWLLGGTYFIAASALDFVTHVGTVDDLSSLARIALVLPAAILDAIFILWIFSALSKTLNRLTARRKAVKLSLYRMYTNTLAIAVWISICWIAFEMFFKVTDSRNTEKWQSYWVTDAFWQVLMFVILAIICTLWRPSKNSQLYTYTEADGDIDMDEISTDPNDNDTQANTDVFSIGDEEENKMA